MNPKEIENLVQSAQEYDYIRFTFSDICGAARGETVPKRHVARFIRDGIGLYSGLKYSWFLNCSDFFDEVLSTSGGKCHYFELNYTE